MLEYRKTDDLKTDILNVTKLLMKDNGYEKTTFQEISEILGITKGAITYHYRNKHLIAAQIVRDYFMKIRRYVDELLPDEDNIYYKFCIVYIYAYHGIYGNPNSMDIFYNDKEMKQWSDGAVDYVKEYYVRIAENFHREVSSEQCYINALTDLGARIFLHRKYIEEPGKMSLDQLIRYHLNMMGTLSRIDEISMNVFIGRAFDTYHAHDDVQFDMFEIA